MAARGIRSAARIATVCGAALLVFAAHAGIELHRVASFLVFPYVVAESAAETGNTVETFITFTNTAENPYQAHVVLINGNEFDSQYCFECGFDIPVSGLATTSVVVTRSGGLTRLRELTTGQERTCAARVGFITVDVEDFNFLTLTDNVLLGHSLTVNYTTGASVDLEAIPVQGDLGDGDRNFSFDDLEYRKFPAALASGFIAPDFGAPPGIGAELVLFNLAFKSRFPPLALCSLTGIDAAGGLFSNDVLFGCYARRSLEDIDPEFAYPFLGDGGGLHEHGNVQLQCEVCGTGPNPCLDGGVHGVLIQSAAAGSPLRRNVAGPAVGGAVRWGRVLSQSATVGDPMILELDPPPFQAK